MKNYLRTLFFYGKLKEIRHEIDKGAKIDWDDAMELTIHNYHVDVARYILVRCACKKIGIRLNAWLIMSMRYIRNIEILEMILKFKGTILDGPLDVDTALRMTNYHCFHLETVRILVERGAKVNARCLRSFVASSLMSTRHEQLLKFLVDHFVMDYNEAIRAFRCDSFECSRILFYRLGFCSMYHIYHYDLLTEFHLTLSETFPKLAKKLDILYMIESYTIYS